MFSDLLNTDHDVFVSRAASSRRVRLGSQARIGCAPGTSPLRPSRPDAHSGPLTTADDGVRIARSAFVMDVRD